MNTRAILDSWNKDHILILDGAMGTMLQSLKLSEADFRGDRFKNHVQNLAGNNDILNLTQPHAIANVHSAYLEAGAQILKTNTFNSTTVSQADYATTELAYELNVAGARIARECVTLHASKHPNRPCFVAGSIGPTSKTLSISPDVNNPAFRATSFDLMTTAYITAVEGLIDGGSDIIIIETIFDTLNAKAAIFATLNVFQKRGIEMPIMISGTITDASGRTLSGQTPSAFLYSLEHSNPFSIGFNCALGAHELKRHIVELAAHSPFGVSMHPNAGLPDAFGLYNDTPEIMAAIIGDIAQEGLLNVVGGCCGTTPAHIQAIADAVASIKPRKVDNPEKGSFFSGLEPLAITQDSLFANIGERTNVTGSSKFATLIKSNDFESAIDVARNQVDNGAQIIDVNMDEAMLDSVAAMQEFLHYVSSEPAVSKVPIMVDSSKWETIIAGVKCVQGKCIVNSISLKEGEGIFLERALLLRHLGAAVVVMAFDENGQADTFQKKIDICSRSYTLLTEKAGVNPSDIIFDPNIFAIATGLTEHSLYGIDFINAVAWLRKTYPLCQISGGLSNVSFSFRGNNALREAINTVFLYHAIKAGLSMGIVNPATLGIFEDVPTELRERIEDVIFNRREDATERLLAVADSASSQAKGQTIDLSWRELPIEARISHSLVHGIDRYIEHDAKEALEVLSKPLLVIEGPLMNGMNAVGELFGAGKMFLPQVIKSARVMKKAVAYLTPFMQTAGSDRSYQGTVVLATVKGDVHDIGKKIVEVVLACNNYKVIDCGVMVPCETILDTAIKEKADIIGLSGLITPSLDEMCSVAAEMEKRALTVPLILGGATTSKKHTAVKIAPRYTKPVVHVVDASLAVGVCQKLMSPTEKDAYCAEIARDYTTIRENYENSSAQAALLPYQTAKQRKLVLDFNTYTPPKPRTILPVVLKNYPLETLRPYIDWTFFYTAWEIPGTYPALLSDEKYGIQAQKLFAEANVFLDKLIAQRRLKAHGVVGILPANSKNNEDIIVYTNDTRTAIAATVPCLRQQTPKADNKPLYSLADFIAPHESLKADYLGFFAVTAGDGLAKIVAECEAANDDYSAIMVKVLADRLAEAFAEKLHEEVRKDYWGYAPNENISIDEMFRVRYQGIRPAPGYPACPDHALKSTLFSLLDVEKNCGISLTDSKMMTPEASVCGYYFSHPQSAYFGLTAIDADQARSYASRNGDSFEEAKKRLSQICKS